MNSVKKNILVPYSARQMYDVVENVEQYPLFLPWCGAVREVQRTASTTVATLDIAYHGLRYSFSTRNDIEPGGMITITLLHGPFKHLDGRWRFIALDQAACKVEFELTYSFSSQLLEKILAPVFNPIADGLIDAFVERAEKLYAKR